MNDECLSCLEGWEQGQHIIAIGYVGKDGVGGIRLVHRACLLREVAGTGIEEPDAPHYLYIAKEVGSENG